MNPLIVIGSTREKRRTADAAYLVREVFKEKGHEPEIFDLKEKEIPFLGNRPYVDSEEPAPEDIQDFSKKVEETDCLIIISPEYNHSIPGVLKNALDFLYPEYNDKPFAYVTTSAGGFGGIRALDHLQDITLALGGFPGPSLQVSKLGQKFEDGKLVEEEFEGKVRDFVEETEEHVEKINS